MYLFTVALTTSCAITSI